MDIYIKNILHYLDIYKKNWLLILLVVGLSVTFAAVKAHREPLVYHSTVTTLNIVEKSQVAVLGQSLGLSGLSENKGSAYETIAAILRSRRMSIDVNKRFNQEGKPGFWWQMSVNPTPAGFAVKVKGPDPDLTADVANFIIGNLDKINEELKVSADKPMVKVLDSAVRGSADSRNIFKGALIAGAFSFLACSFCLFLIDYLKTLQASA